tara:strand:- start:5065 stop:5334 length:270 start_codon:yes stop_codon:yes gene_type:complete
MTIKTEKVNPVQWTVEVIGRGDSEFTRFYLQEEFNKFMEDIGHRWSELNLQSYCDYYSITHKGYVDWNDLTKLDKAWLFFNNITEQHDC